MSRPPLQGMWGRQARRRHPAPPVWALSLLAGLGEVGHALEDSLDLAPEHATAPRGSPRPDRTVVERGNGEGAGRPRSARFPEALARAVEINRRAVAALDDLA